MKHIKGAFTSHGDIVFMDIKDREREKVIIAKQPKVTEPMLSLQTENTFPVLKTALSAMATTKTDEVLVLQIVLGESYAPTPAPDKAANPHATLLDTIRGRIGMASKESLSKTYQSLTNTNFNLSYLLTVRPTVHVGVENSNNGAIMRHIFS